MEIHCIRIIIMADWTTIDLFSVLPHYSVIVVMRWWAAAAGSLPLRLARVGGGLYYCQLEFYCIHYMPAVSLNLLPLSDYEHPTSSTISLHSRTLFSTWSSSYVSIYFNAFIKLLEYNRQSKYSNTSDCARLRTVIRV